MSERGGGGPYRKDADPNTESSIEKMEKEIAVEGKFVGIRLPEDLNYNSSIERLDDALKSNIAPQDISFYSLSMGILQHSHHEEIPHKGNLFSKGDRKIFTYNNKNHPYVKLQITIEKNKAKITTITNKESSERMRMRVWRDAFMFLTDNLNGVEDLINRGVNPKIEKEYLADLHSLQNRLESLLSTVNEELKKK